ncbi:Xaa-Pro aminopeptidase [Aliikangiella coralliicola]|uniref:Xaa-Pro aminopeptidase n=2 Tax=Aliikangiella coralliicola TaxID=2592383 RepID=A0A545UIK3_9GAMM|nr:Xaa-Pro aminopeptidase [Aliikangiella coralliicola]TQV89302.1 Xaa-Pro aminopeptidase [Aliikangiella coralliicola]
MISRAEYARRRRELMDLMGKNSIAILPSAKEVVRSRDTHFSFRQDSDFHYLTGFPEPDAVLVLLPGREHGEYVMFCREKDPKMETWHGRREGQAGAKKNYGCNDAFPIDDIDEILPGLMEGRERIYYEFGNHAEFDNNIMSWVNTFRAQVKKGAHPPGELIDLSYILHDMRLIKSKAEIKVMRKAAEISANAHKAAMKVCQPGMNELQIEAELKYQFANQGARFEAYSSIVAGGENACILHYVENKDPLQDGDLLLIDAGAELDGYAADISRTFPVNGRYSDAQREAYDWVLKANKEAIKAAKPGNHWSAPHDVAVRILTKGLIAMKILEGDLDQLIQEEAYKPFYMHKTGHWIGLDVHDVGDYLQDREPRILAEGMVLTVEPGLYFTPKTKGLDKKWWGIGIRIEDDVLITAKGNSVLTKSVPKEASQVEKLMADG